MAPRKALSSAMRGRKHQQSPARLNPASRSQRGKSDKQAPPLPPAEHDYCVVVGIDFGATYSAVAYTPASKKAFLNRDLVPLKADELGLVAYDDCLHSDDKEVPSQMKYDREIVGQGPVRWGYTVENDRTWKNGPTSWEKLLYPKVLLSSKAGTENFLQSARRLAKKMKKDEESIVADFLKKLIEELDVTLRSKYPQFQSAERFYYCGYPPAWPGRDVDRLISACEKAGMSNIQLVSEPTAAATALLEGMSPTILASNGLVEGETFLLIDAGGMTVEFTVLKILSVSPIAVEQLTVGNGEYCGSGYCNLRFRDWVMNHQRFRDLWIKNRRKLTDIADHAANVEFEFLVKRKLKPDDDLQAEFRIELPSHLIPGLEDWRADENDPTSVVRGYKKVPEFVLSREHVGQFMEECFESITNLALDEIRIAEEMGINTSKVVLTGGFGRNILLQHRIRERFSEQHKNAEVIQPDQKPGAVAHGILHMAMNQSAVVKSRMRHSLGVDEKQDYNPKKHQADVVRWPVSKGHSFVESIHWLLKKGAEIEFNKPLTFPREIQIDIDNEDEWRLTTEIITSSITSEDHLDRLGEHTGKVEKKSNTVYHDIRSDCHCDEVLVVDLRSLSESDKRAYLGLQSGKKRQGTFKFNIEYVVRHDNRLDFWMIPSRRPKIRWKMVPEVSDREESAADYVDLNEHERFRRDELTFPSPSRETKLTDGFRKLSVEQTSDTQHSRLSTKHRTKPSRRGRRSNQPTAESVDIYTYLGSPSPDSSVPPGAKTGVTKPPKPVTPRKRAAESTMDIDSVQSSQYTENQRSLRTPVSRSPTLQVSAAHAKIMHGALQDPHPENDPFTSASNKGSASAPSPASSKKPKTTAKRSRVQHSSISDEVLTRSSSSSHQQPNSPPPRPSPEIPSSNINPSQVSSINRWTSERPKRSVKRVNYRMLNLNELEDVTSDNEINHVESNEW